MSQSLPAVYHCDDQPVDELVRRLHGGEVAVSQLPRAVRCECIEHLAGEGFTTSQIAQVLGVSDRTVRRDRAVFRRRHAVAPDRRLGDELFGEYYRLTLASIQRLTRLACDPETPAYCRVWAERAIGASYQRLIETAHRLHYLEDGRSRLEQQRQADPAERERFREKMANLRKMLGM